MREPGLAVWRAHQAAAELVRPGVNTAEIEAAVAAHFESIGAEPLFLGVPHHTDGLPPFPAVTCISVNEEIVHGIPGERTLAEGDIVSIDTGCRINGWCGDAAITHSVGKVSPDVQKLLDVTRQTLELAIELMAVKTRWSDVAAELGAFVLDNGMSPVEDFVGHGIGREMHEDPQVPNYSSPEFIKEGDFPLRPGVVLAIEPMVNLGGKEVTAHSDLWTQKTSDGKPSAHFEHTVALTKEGPRVLTAAPGEDYDYLAKQRAKQSAG